MQLKHILYFAGLLCFCYTAKTQVCTGSLGDPVVNITFGTGANPGLSLPPVASAYSYTSADCPKQGEYAIRNFTFLCADDSWYTVPFDHTAGDGSNGYYMEINGDDKRDYYTNTSSGLCPNTTYELSFWVMNLLKPGACEGNAVDPNIIFSVETVAGIVLASGKTGDIVKKNEATWNRYSLLFRTDGVSTSVRIRLANNAASGCGNDFLLDDIAIHPCGPSILAYVAENGTAVTGACEGDARALVLSASVSNGFQSPAYQWQESMSSGNGWRDIPGANGTNYLRTATAAGNYQYRVLVGESANMNAPSCRLSSNLVTVIIEKAPFAQGTNYSYCLGQEVTLFAAGGEKYIWSGPNGFSSNQQSPVIPNVKFSDSGLYKVEVTTTRGCKASDSTRLSIFSNPIAYATPEFNICEGSSIHLNATGGSQYNWTPSKNLSFDNVSNPVARPNDSTVYTVRVTLNGCYDTASVKVNVWKKPVANAGPDKRIIKGQSVTLSGSAKGTDIQYHWTPSSNINNINLLSPLINSLEDTRYTLHAISNKGCGTSADDVFVKVYEKVNVPNAFSPNGDGINDFWIIDPLDLFNDSEIQVVNRYGQQVYSSRGYSKPWDGKRNGHPLPTASYYYIINLNNGAPLVTGQVLIVR